MKARDVLAAMPLAVLLYAGPLLDALAGYLLILEAHREIGALVLLVNGVMVLGVLCSFLPEWLRPPGHALAVVIVHYNVNVWLALLALIYSVAVGAWLPALVLLAGVVLPEIGGRGVIAWLARKRRPVGAEDGPDEDEFPDLRPPAG